MHILLLKRDSRPRVAILQKSTKLRLSQFLQLRLGWRPKYPEISLRICFSILWSHNRLVSEKATDYRFIKYQSGVYGDDSLWERSSFLKSFIQRLGNPF